MPLSSQSIGRSALRALAVQALLAAKTDAGISVFEPRTIPLTPYQLPVLIVSAPSERKEPPASGRGMTVPQFHSTIMLAIEARVEGKGTTGSRDAEIALERLVGQAELALLSGPIFITSVEKITFLETHQVVTVEGEQPIGEATILIGCQVWQQFDPEDGPALTEMDVTTAAAPAVGPAFQILPPQ